MHCGKEVFWERSLQGKRRNNLLGPRRQPRGHTCDGHKGVLALLAVKSTPCLSAASFAWVCAATGALGSLVEQEGHRDWGAGHRKGHQA